MICFSGPLIFIQDKERIFVIFLGSLDSHIALYGGNHKGFPATDPDTGSSSSTSPAWKCGCHSAVIPADPVHRKPIYILGIHDTCRQRWSQDALRLYTRLAEHGLFCRLHPEATLYLSLVSLPFSSDWPGSHSFRSAQRHGKFLSWLLHR